MRRSASVSPDVLAEGHVSGFVVNDEDGAARGDFLAVFRRSAARNLPRVAPPPHAFDF
jgi:hypothetical protein